MSHRSTVRTPRPRRLAGFTLTAAAALTATALVLTGCDAGGDDASGEPHAKGPSVIAPAGPGEPAETLAAEEAAKRKTSDKPNSADFAYAQMMITHHAQALEMTRLAPRQAESSKVRRLAERISSAQGPEIKAMQGWLTNHGGAGRGDGHEHHHGGSMPGMATKAQLDRLRAADGADFDALFLQLMITHHDGAITMATEVLSDGNNVQIEEMAGDVIAQQTAEISRMRGMS